MENLNIEQNNNQEEIDNNEGQEIQLNDSEKAALEKAQEYKNRIENETDLLNTEEINTEENNTNEETLLAGKYKNREELLKGVENIGGNELPEYVLNGMNDESLSQYYKELESKKGKSEGDNEEKPNEETKQEETKQEEIKVEDFNKYFEEFQEKNEISEDSYKELQEKHKLPKEVVDAYIEGQRLIQENSNKQAEEEVLEVIGGRENYNEVVDWASKNLSKEEIEEFNELVSNPTTSKLAVKNLYLQYKSNNTEKPNGKLINGNSNIKNGEFYQSREEWISDMKNPNYHRDAGFRQKVMRKLKNSNL